MCRKNGALQNRIGDLPLDASSGGSVCLPFHHTEWLMKLRGKLSVRAVAPGVADVGRKQTLAALHGLQQLVAHLPERGEEAVT